MSLINRWAFDGDSVDSISGFNGTDTNITYTSGKIGQAAYFNGTLPSKIMFTPFSTGASYTISMWINPEIGTTTIYSALFANNDGLTGIYYQNIAQGVVFYYGGDHESGIIIQGVWTHVTLVNNSGNVKFYINGSPDAVTYTGGPAFNASTVGGDPFGENYTGLIDDLRFYNNALSSAEILALYNSYSSNSNFLPFFL